jgi:hypothetical protein
MSEATSGNPAFRFASCGLHSQVTTYPSAVSERNPPLSRLVARGFAGDAVGFDQLRQLERALRFEMLERAIILKSEK